MSRYNLLEKLIPETHEREDAGRPSISTDERKRIIGAFGLCNGNIQQMAKATGHAWATIARVLDEEGLFEETLCPGAPSLPEGEVGRIISIFKSYNSNAKKTALETGHGISTVIKICRSRRLRIRPSGRGGHDTIYHSNK